MDYSYDVLDDSMDAFKALCHSEVRCSKCATPMTYAQEQIYNSAPPQYLYKCPDCWHSQFSYTPPLWTSASSSAPTNRERKKESES